MDIFCDNNSYNNKIDIDRLRAKRMCMIKIYMYTHTWMSLDKVDRNTSLFLSPTMIFSPVPKKSLSFSVGFSLACKNRWKICTYANKKLLYYVNHNLLCFILLKFTSVRFNFHSLPHTHIYMYIRTCDCVCLK